MFWWCSVMQHRNGHFGPHVPADHGIDVEFGLDFVEGNTSELWYCRELLLHGDGWR